MIVDDNESVCQGINNFIDWESLGVTVVATCSNGQEGYMTAKDLRPDFIITDVDMPLLNGLEMASRLRDEGHESSFIFISCFDDFNFVQRAMEMKAFKYVLKPVIFEDLTNSVKLLCEETKMKNRQKQQFDEMRKHAESYSEFLKEQFYKDLLYGSLRNIDDIAIRMNNLQIDLENKEFAVAVIETGNIEKIFQDEKPIIARLLEMPLFKNHALFAEKNRNTVIYIMAASKGDADVFNEEMRALGEQIRNETESKQFFVGVSPFSSEITEMPHLLDMAKQAVGDKFYDSDRCVIIYNADRDFAEMNVDLPVLRSEIKEALHNGYDGILERYYTKPIADGKNCIMQENALRMLTFRMANFVQSELVELGIRKKYMLEDETTIWEALLTAGTIEEIKLWITEFFSKAVSELGKQENSRYGKLTEDIKEIIHERYKELKNVEQIVKPLYISSGHANLIFKNVMGMSISDYLTKTKIKAAEKMLLDSSYTTARVVEDVGYKNYTYFVMKFKEHTGMTPKQYRNSVRKKENE
jgi:Response regulator containing CheY-like receiver domain and AraC-type DNA-binding domain